MNKFLGNSKRRAAGLSVRIGTGDGDGERGKASALTEARIWLESSQPADGEAAAESVHQAFVGGNEFCLGRQGQREI